MTSADTGTTDISAFETTAVLVSGISPSSPAAAAINARAAVMLQTQAAEAAVVRPANPGAWPHALRAALAARIAKANQEPALAEHFLAEAGEFAALADPNCSGETWDSTPATAPVGQVDTQQIAAVVAFMDKVAGRTKDVAATDIAGLQAGGIADDDIVRLCELNAFLAYQLRLITGLRLLAGEAP